MQMLVKPKEAYLSLPLTQYLLKKRPKIKQACVSQHLLFKFSMSMPANSPKNI